MRMYAGRKDDDDDERRQKKKIFKTNESREHRCPRISNTHIEVQLFFDCENPREKVLLLHVCRHACNGPLVHGFSIDVYVPLDVKFSRSGQGGVEGRLVNG